MESGLRTPGRPNKRQKITPASSSVQKPISSRILKTVKQAVYGKQLKILENDIFGPNITSQKHTANGVPQSALHGSKDFVAEEDAIDELGDDQDGIMTATPTKSHSSAHKAPAKVQVVTGTGTAGNTTKVRNESPSRKGRKKYRGWEYLKEGEDVGINNQDAFAKIAEEAAKEAAKDKTEGKEVATVSSKSLRERKKRSSLEPVKVDKQRVTKARRAVQKRVLKQDNPLFRANRRVDDRERSSGAYNVSAGDGSDDELHKDKPFREEATAVRVETPKKSQSASKEATRARSEDVVDLADTWNTPRKYPSGKTTKRVSTEMAMDFHSTSVPQLKESVAASQQSLSIAASSLKGFLSDYPAALTNIKTRLIFQLTTNCCLPVLPPHLSREFETLHQLLSRTVQAGEGNSMLVIGSRGSGKTALVERAISDLIHSNRDDFYVVRLNGFVHTDDKVALREIWRQLGKELEGKDEDTGLRTNYADALTSLLALLSHQDESQEGGEEQTSAARSVIFILDEFDLFAQHSRQTLLYNLFDVAQSYRNAPIAVLGLTTKLNVVDSLEKRVKSRFSQRSVHVALPKNFQAYKAACLETLTYHSLPISSLAKSTQNLPEDIVSAWNTYAKTLFSTEHLTKALRAYYATTNRPKDFQTAIALPFLYAFTPSDLSSVPQLPSYTTLAAPDSVLVLLPTLSTLELSLLIATCRLDIILSTDICSFDMAYDEYTKLISKSKVQMSTSGQMASGSGARVWSRQMARWAWQALGSVGLIVPTVGGGGGASFDRDGSWRADVSLEEIGTWLEGDGKGAGGTQGLVNWCREL